MKIEDINKSTWYKKRCVGYVPRHFIITQTPVTNENLTWLYERTYGRFAFIEHELPVWEEQSLAFEDPKEAVQYELTRS